MANPLHIPSPDHNQATAELLHRLICLPDAYPWEPQDPATESYYAALEAELPEDFSADNRETFWSLLDAQWQKFDQPLNPAASAVALLEQFQSFPRQLLADIAARATQLAQNLTQEAGAEAAVATTTLADHLVQCVQQAFPNWSVDDLYVLARPYAYAMRSTTAAPTPEGDWEQLSELEQVRLSLAVAKAALEQQQAQS